MGRNRKAHRSSRHTTAKQPPRELPPDRAFVLQLDGRAQPPRHVAGRVEHITSGQVAHISSLRELLAFLAKVLRNHRPGDQETTNATLVREDDHRDLAANAPASLDQIANTVAAPVPRTTDPLGSTDKTRIKRAS